MRRGPASVVLDTDAVSDNMAARLCITFIGHVLFLKNQVPFPIVQLARIPAADDTTRAAKKRHELLNSFDTLASHLYTTFIALSTAFALQAPGHHRLARAFFAVALGPTIGTARSRVIVGIDGLETRLWGLREDTPPSNATQASDKDDGPVENTSGTDDEGKQSGGDESGVSGEEDGDASGSDNEVSPPTSRSPSPSPSSDSDASPSTSSQHAHSTTPSLQTEDPETVRAAERLLSRTLASACAEDDGHDLVSEMAPTQIHVLLRAPRRFDHPCWTPRQNLCSSLDGYLADFLAESGETPISCPAAKPRAKAGKAQGLWIKSRECDTRVKCSEEGLAEDDELIWWSWDGKLVGFTDW